MFEFDWVYLIKFLEYNLSNEIEYEWIKIKMLVIKKEVKYWVDGCIGKIIDILKGVLFFLFFGRRSFYVLIVNVWYL